jgi:S-adenosylmethionine:tRNA ribosyltransferase-isomerase
MNTSDFDYTLPPDLIAQTPIEPRYASRLMVLNRATNAVVHAKFGDIDRYLRSGDLLVMNDTRVLPARIRAHKNTGGAVEILMLRRRAPLTWEVLVGGKGVRLGTKLEIAGKPGLSAIVMEELDGSRRLIQFSEPITPLLPTIGEVPLPPYIHTTLADPERYQTVFAKVPGSAAAPTSGLHFTPALLASLAAAGVRQTYVTLHIGLDTFAPVAEARVEEHKIHTEWCHLSRDAAKAINETRAKGGRVIAVGTTVVRVLETAARFSSDDELSGETRPLDPKLARPSQPPRVIQPVIGNTDLFITPGHQFQAVDALITNFHLPRSTLLMMVAAFAGRDRILAAYEAAKAERYRFYSFGDAMLIL